MADGCSVEVVELRMFRRDTHDYEVGSTRWQEIMTYNCVISLLQSKPLTPAEMSFIRIQNDHLILQKRKRKGKGRKASMPTPSWK